MHGNEEILKVLNEVLAAELQAVNQYMVNSKLYASWGLNNLAAKARGESIDEMQHAEALIDRILFLNGKPNLSGIGGVTTTTSVTDQFRGDIKIELDAVATLQRGITLCLESADHGTRALFEQILADEETHLEWLETQVALIDRVGETQYLTQQLRPVDPQSPDG